MNGLLLSKTAARAQTGKGHEILNLLLPISESTCTVSYTHLGFLDGAVDRRLEKKVDLFAEDALNQLCGSNKVRATELISEVENCKKDICAEILKRDPALAGDVDRILAGRPEEQALPKLVDEGKAVNLDQMCIRDSYG